MSHWPMVKLGEVLRAVPRPVDVNADTKYHQIGIRSHGKGVFHKEAVSGLELGNKKVFWMCPGDFVINIVFGWEGAVALLSEAEAGMIASHRFPTFRPDESRLDGRFLLNYCKTTAGLDLLSRVSPGGAGRNRTLSKTSFLQQSIPLPSLSEQQRIVTRIEELAAQIHEAKRLRKEAMQEAERVVTRTIQSLVDNASWTLCALNDVLAESPRNGLGPQREIEVGGSPMLRINAVSSTPTKFVDISACKSVEVSSAQASPFLLRDGDVFIVRYNGDINRVAKPAIYRGTNSEGAVYPDKLIRLRADPKRIEVDFLFTALNSQTVRSQVEELGKTTAGNIGISGSNVKAFQIPLPPLPEQRRIVAELDALQAEVDSLKRLQAETSAELDALLPSLLDRAFKGEL